MILNIAVLSVAACLIAVFGFLPWLFVRLIIIVVAASCGVWLFYVQHQFEDAYWERDENWDYTAAALEGGSFHKLPRVLQWFSGNIGFHHIHHLSARIPNYNLERCHRSDPMFEEVQPMSLIGSLKSISYRLWDEQSRKLISFAHLKRLRRQTKEAEHGRSTGDDKSQESGHQDGTR